MIYENLLFRWNLIFLSKSRNHAWNFFRSLRSLPIHDFLDDDIFRDFCPLLEVSPRVIFQLLKISMLQLPPCHTCVILWRMNSYRLPSTNAHYRIHCKRCGNRKKRISEKCNSTKLLKVNFEFFISFLSRRRSWKNANRHFFMLIEY